VPTRRSSFLLSLVWSCVEYIPRFQRHQTTLWVNITMYNSTSRYQLNSSSQNTTRVHTVTAAPQSRLVRQKFTPLSQGSAWWGSSTGTTTTLSATSPWPDRTNTNNKPSVFKHGHVTCALGPSSPITVLSFVSPNTPPIRLCRRTCATHPDRRRLGRLP